MQKHIKTYLEYFGIMQHEAICEWCGKQAVDIDHITPRSKFGKNRKKEQDKIENLMGLCRDCHANKNSIGVEKMREKHLDKLL